MGFNQWRPRQRSSGLLTHTGASGVQLAQQFAASVHYIISHHDLEKLDASDEIREVKDPQQANIGESPVTDGQLCAKISNSWGDALPEAIVD